MKNASFRTIGIVSLIGGFLLTISVLGVMSASAAPPSKGEPLSAAQNWDKNLPSSSRFTVLNTFVSSSGSTGAAVRDNNTGLVWDQSPDTVDRTWAQATDFCLNKNDRGPAGWRLPSVVELKSVQDLTLLPPLVPPAIFTNVQPGFYWSATSTAAVPGSAWFVDFGQGGPARNISKTTVFLTWCVRGPMNTDAY